MFSLLIGYRYRSAAVVNSEPAGGPGRALQLVEELRGQPGTRVPHVWVRDGVSTLDLLGPGFTVLTGDERWRGAVTSASAALGIPITVQCIRRRRVGGRHRTCAGGALLVRPDDFVGWRADELPGDPEGSFVKRFRPSCAASAPRADA